MVSLRQRLYDLSQLTERNSKTHQINRIGFKQPEYTTLLTEIYEFNARFATTFTALEPEIKTLLKDYFLPDEDIQVHIKPQGRLTTSYGYRYGLDLPKLHLTLTVNGKPIARPQTFMNEARLTSLALTIRLAMLGRKFKGIKGRDDLRILVLDDLLISLDMSNRMKVIKYLQENPDFKEYQLIIMTHDKGFYERLRTNLARDEANWKWYEMFDSTEVSHKLGRYVNPIVKPKEDYLDLANKCINWY